LVTTLAAGEDHVYKAGEGPLGELTERSESVVHEEPVPTPEPRPDKVNVKLGKSSS
jgi:hypothetical protein